MGGDGVVVVGMACRYPDAHTPRQLWENVLARRQAFRRIPDRRLRLDDYYSPDRAAPDHTYVQRAAVLDGWRFDRERFRVSGALYRSVDLAHWLALEVAADALADASLPGGDGLDRSRVGVVLGNSLTGEFSRASMLRTRWPFVRRVVAESLARSTLPAAEQEELLAELEERFKAPFPPPSDESLAGALSNTIAGRICNHFDFQGTGYTVDAACASSLVAILTAAEAVESDRLDVALAGGVDLSLDPLELVGFARVGALSDGAMRVYDAAPQGFLPGEGCGIVALCRESFAHAMGLRPYARITGWATSSDGSGGLTRPELAGQRLALERAYVRAGVGAHTVGLFEGHGTGTPVGDRIELETLIEVRHAADRAAQPAALGSVKANIGHTKAAAGVAGLLKAVSAIHHELLPPTTGFERPHPLLAPPDAPLRLLDAPEQWSAAHRRAGVSAMGFGGINAHVVVEGVTPTRRRGLSTQERVLAAPRPDHEVVVLGAESGAALRGQLVRLRDAAVELTQAELTDLAASLAAGNRRTGPRPARFAAAVPDPERLVAAVDLALAALDRGGGMWLFDVERRVFLADGPARRVGLLFPGQAAPVPGTCGALGMLLGDTGELYTDILPLTDAVADTSVAQPGIVRASLAGLRWLAELGLRARAGLGHSVGELAALCWAGALGEAEAYQLARARGAAMGKLGDTDGAMVSLATDAEGAAELVADTSVVVAAYNGPRQTVVSGRRAELVGVVARAEARGVTAVWLPVSHAFHSPLMDDAAEELDRYLDRVAFSVPTGQVASTITGSWLPADEDLHALLVRQVTSPVRFADALRALRRDVDVLVEVGPGTIQAGLAVAAGCHAAAMDVGAESAAGVATTTAALFAAGAAADTTPYFRGRFVRPFDIDRAREFLANPCEEAPPVPAAPAARVAVPPRQPAAAEPADGDGMVEVVTRRLAAALELDQGAIRPDARLLADLHLTSLRANQLAGELVTALGRHVPEGALDLANATVEDLATTLAALPAEGAGADLSSTGVAPWTRLFEHCLVRESVDTEAVPRRWRVFDVPGNPLGTSLRESVPQHGAVGGVLLALPTDLGSDPSDAIAAAIRAALASRNPMVVVHHRGYGAAVARSVTAEHPTIPVLAVDVPPNETGVAWALGEAGRAWAGFGDVVYADDGTRLVRRSRALPTPERDDARLPLAEPDTCLVVGGARGIGAACAVALAHAAPAKFVLLGRSSVDHPEVAGTLDRIRAAGGRAEYLAVDVTDADAVRDVLRGVEGIRGLVHAAGANTPRRIEDLTAADLRRTLAPKVRGLDNVLAALDVGKLRFAVGFGSVIGRTGLAGEADYAIANEWLASRFRELAVAHTGVRWLVVEWSVWAGVGMGARLGVLDGLTRQGVDAIPVDAGADLFLRLLAADRTPVTVLAAGRLPRGATLRWADETPPLRRFVASPTVLVPGVELVAETELSAVSDPYLADHRLDGVPLLPAVLGLEAMAQAAQAVTGRTTRPVFTAVKLAAPVTVPDDGPRRVQVAALVRDGGADGDGLVVDLVLRSEETGFAAEAFSATCTFADAERPERCSAPAPDVQGADGLYGTLFFHGERFRRVRGYHSLGAYACQARIACEPAARWFSGFHAQELVLGDPGARDAAIHALQGCVPHRRVLPVAVERIVVHAPPDGELVVHARQRSEGQGRYTFDLVLSDEDGLVREEWHGLVLADVGPIVWPEVPEVLAEAYATRTGGR